MADKTGISWTDATWNPLRGCSKVSAGCKNCYAEKVAARFSGPGAPYEGTIRDGRWNGNIRLVAEMLSQPLKWKRPRRIFVNSMSDLFHDGVPFEYVAAVFGVMAACPQHTFQVLTKRPERAVEFFRWVVEQDRPAGRLANDRSRRDNEGTHGRLECCWQALAHEARESDAGPLHTKHAADSAGPWPLPNVHLGVSVEDQSTADARIPHLLRCPAAVRFVSYEPALGPVDFTQFMPRLEPMGDGVRGLRHVRGLQWVIVGGESGAKARPFDVAWARSTIDQCREAGVKCFVKQVGRFPVEYFADRLPEPMRFKDKAGADPAEWPADLRVQEFPA